MSALVETHPIQEAFAFVNLIKARADQQLLFRQLADWGIEELHEAEAVFVEIAADAANGRDLVNEVASDGVITDAERKQINDLLAEIETEAREGRVIRS